MKLIYHKNEDQALFLVTLTTTQTSCEVILIVSSKAICQLVPNSAVYISNVEICIPSPHYAVLTRLSKINLVDLKSVSSGLVKQLNIITWYHKVIMQLELLKLWLSIVILLCHFYHWYSELTLELGVSYETSPWVVFFFVLICSWTFFHLLSRMILLDNITPENPDIITMWEVINRCPQGALSTSVVIYAKLLKLIKLELSLATTDGGTKLDAKLV